MDEKRELIREIALIRSELRSLRDFLADRKTLVNCMKRLSDTCHKYNMLYVYNTPTQKKTA